MEFSVWRYNFQVVAPSVLGTFFTTADIRSENFSYLPSDPDDWSTGSDWGVETDPIPPAKKVSKKQKKKARDQRYKESQKEFDINIALCVSFYAIFLSICPLIYSHIYNRNIMKKAEDDFLQSTTEIHQTNNKGNAQHHKANFIGQDLPLPKTCSDEPIPSNTETNCDSMQLCSATSPDKTMEKTTAIASGIWFLFKRYSD